MRGPNVTDLLGMGWSVGWGRSGGRGGIGHGVNLHGPDRGTREQDGNHGGLGIGTRVNLDHCCWLWYGRVSGWLGDDVVRGAVWQDALVSGWNVTFLRRGVSLNKQRKKKNSKKK